jgi:glyoxylase-like metal-dependent hydrolase (beta-lactamase superfamily II)
MLRPETFTFNVFQENTYLIINGDNHCWIVDPGMYDIEETNHFFSFIDDNKLIPQAVINTHAHLDHIFGVQACKDKYNIPFLLHKKEMPVLQNAMASAALFGFNWTNVPQADDYIEDGKPLMLGNDAVAVKFTPGHSPGSIIFFYAPGNWAICGDVLFNGSIGRTDLPGGDFDTLINSIKTELFTLPEDTVIYSGHGPATDIGNEQRHNPFLRK